MKCNKCSIGTIPKYDTENLNWICVNCDVSYEENDEIICADELCADDPLTTFDTNLKECTMCPLNSYLDQVTDECKGQDKKNYYYCELCNCVKFVEKVLTLTLSSNKNVESTKWLSTTSA